MAENNLLSQKFKNIFTRIMHFLENLTEPHHNILERDQRRLARLLSALILSVMGLALLVEGYTTALISWKETYTGYRETLLVVGLLFFVYLLSRTQYFRLAAYLTVIVSILGAFMAAVAEPLGAVSGLMDYLLVPIFVAGLFFEIRYVILTYCVVLAGLFILPLLVPEITFDLIAVGPISFLSIMTVLVGLMLHTRNRLEEDRRMALVNSEKRAQKHLSQLQALRAIDIAITSGHDLQKTLNVILDQLIAHVEVDVAVILLLNKENQILEFAGSRGLRTQALRFTKLKIGQGIAGVAAKERTIVQVNDLQKNEFLFSQAPLLKDEGVVSYLAVPLVSEDQVRGVFEIFYRTPFAGDDEWMSFLETLATQAAIAIDRITLLENLQRTNLELSKAYDETIEGWSRALDLRDRETVGHTLRVTDMTLRLAKTFPFNEKELTFIRWGALLHDIGKMGIPDAILLKPDALNESEWEIMRRHPVYARDMLVHIEHLHPALDIPYCHHEKWDGTGYPRGLKGEEIPLSARIFAVIDVWDALSSNRPYRRAWSSDRVFEYLRAQAGSFFDPQIVDSFLELWEVGTETVEI